MKHDVSRMIAQGKTKDIFSVFYQPTLVIIRNRDDLTAFDDPTKTVTIPGKGPAVTATTCRVFELLRQAGLPIAYREQYSETDFLALRCQMIPLEVVVRRYAYGSALKRCPELLQGYRSSLPPRFENLVVEFFLKTSGGQLVMPNGQVLIDGLSPEEGEEDPLIPDPLARPWKLLHSKKRLYTPESDLGKEVDPYQLLSPQFKEHVKTMRSIAVAAFTVLEKSWQALGGFRLIDFKLEFGFISINNLCIADVIDSDSWRLWDHNNKDLSKQTFRDGGSPEEVLANYQLVAGLSRQLQLVD